jgi:hypothetical protein
MGVELNQKALKCSVILIVLLAVPLGVQAQTQIHSTLGVYLARFYDQRKSGGVAWVYDSFQPSGFVGLGASKAVSERSSLYVGLSYTSYRGLFETEPRYYAQRVTLRILEAPIFWQYIIGSTQKRLLPFFQLGLAPALLLQAKGEEDVGRGFEEIPTGETNTFQCAVLGGLGLRFQPNPEAKLSLQTSLQGRLALTQLAPKAMSYYALTPTLGLAYRL